MKSSLLSLLAAGLFFVTTAASAAPALDHGPDPRRMSPIERSRYEAVQLKAQRENERRQAQERARYEAAQRKQAQQQRLLAQERARLEAKYRADQQKAAERARWEAQHRNDKGRDDHGRDYGYNHH
jgi:hypothetical protein